MKTTELRIGNMVLVPIMPSQVIIPSYPKKIKGITIFGELDFTEPSYPEKMLIPAKHCAGIPLTAEWLLKFEFECWFDGALKKFYVLHNVIDGTSDFEVTLQDGKAYPSIDENCIYWRKEFHVHQLQNLYFALTGEELLMPDTGQ